MVMCCDLRFFFLRSILTFLDEVEKAEDDAISEISQVNEFVVNLKVFSVILFQIVPRDSFCEIS